MGVWRWIDDATISIYLTYFAEAYLLRQAKQYDIKGRKYINTPQKYFLTDVGAAKRPTQLPPAGGNAPDGLSYIDELDGTL